MFLIFRNSISIKYLLLLFLFYASCEFNPSSIGIVSETHAQTREQMDIANRLGISLDDLKEEYGGQETGIGKEMEDFIIEPIEEEDKVELRTYLGFRGNLSRFGEDLFYSNRGEFKIADDAQAPDDYLLGLGDQIIIQYYGAESESYTIEIDRNGSILLPKIGPINLNGLKLHEAQELIRTRVKSQLVGVNATVTIGKTKFINIFIAGNVLSPGVYSMPALSRVTHALYLSGGINDLGTYRNIQVKRGGKVVGKVDLYDFLINGDNSSDINLRSNDVILVGETNKNIQITGAVKRQGIFELIGNESAETLIRYAGGMAPGSDVDSVIYSSLVSDEPNKILNFNKKETLAFFDGDSIHFNFKAAAFSKVNNTNRNVTTASAIRVNIQGEVNYPGTYLMVAGERISNLMERAGGPTNASFLDGAVFTREKVRQREAFRARELAEEVRRQVVSSSQTQSSNRMDVDDVEFITEQLDNYTGIGRVIIDLPRALAGRRDADLVLSDGDALYVPEKSNTITVFGEVRRQSSYVFNSQFEIDDYLTLAAGITQLADEDNIYIVKANGNVTLPKGGWFKFGSDKLLNEGDTIIVPVDYDYRQSLPFWKDVISIVYQGAVAIAAISGL